MPKAKYKIKWTVHQAETGLAGISRHRAWPDAEVFFPGDEEGQPIASISCDDAYYPPHVKTGNHVPLKLRITVWHSPEDWDEKGHFSWVRFRKEFATLQEAKDFLKDVAKNHSEKFGILFDFNGKD